MNFLWKLRRDFFKSTYERVLKRACDKSISEEITLYVFISTGTIRDFSYENGPEEMLGWGPHMRLSFGYFTPDDWYEAIIN